MAFCMNCGKQLPDGAKFCLECGTKLGDANAEQTPKRETTYEGKIYKCPNCGDILDAYESVCESCGYERRGTKATSSVQELAQKLQQIEEKRPANDILSIYKKQMEEGAKIISKTDQQKIELIKNFPIPNNKEDMYEFLVLALSNVDTRTYGLAGGSYTHKAISNAWYTKLEQAYTKAKFAFGKRPDFDDITAIYQEKHREIALAKKKKVRAILAIVFGSIAFAAALVGLILVLAIPAAKQSAAEDSEKVKQETARLDAIVLEVYDAIENEDYVLARAKAATVVFRLPAHGYETEDWDQVRAGLLEIIDKAEQGLDYDPIPIETTG